MIIQSDKPYEYFHLIRRGLIRALDNSGNYLSVGDAFNFFLSGQWVLHIFHDHEGYCGFAATEIIPTATGQWLNVPFAYTESDMYEEFFGHLSEVALESGYAGVKFVSSRKGFSKMAEKYGWKKGFTEWIVSDFT